MSVGLRRWVLPLLSNLGLKSIKFLDGINCIEPKGVKYKKSLEDSYEEIELPLEVHAIPYTRKFAHNIGTAVTVLLTMKEMPLSNDNKI